MEFRTCAYLAPSQEVKRPESDLDLLADVENRRSLFSLIAAKQEIEELIGRKVDIVAEDSLRGPRRESILRDATAL
jgi:uncharacterized protein